MGMGDFFWHTHTKKEFFFLFFPVFYRSLSGSEVGRKKKVGYVKMEPPPPFSLSLSEIGGISFLFFLFLGKKEECIIIAEK